MLWSLPEIEADFLAIYGREVDLMGDERDTGNLSGPRFLNLCMQLPAYAGAVAMAARRWAAENAPDPEPEPVATLMLNPDLEVSRG